MIKIGTLVVCAILFVFTAGLFYAQGCTAESVLCSLASGAGLILWASFLLLDWHKKFYQKGIDVHELDKNTRYRINSQLIFEGNFVLSLYDFTKKRMFLQDLVQRVYQKDLKDSGTEELTTWFQLACGKILLV